jgi:2-hydroxyglutarate dehydrogenase
VLRTCSSEGNHYDLVVVGGGIVGLATAREVATRYPNMKIAVAEKENDVALHQSGHNSGVLHTGIYYTPGSLKARLCVRGIKMAYDYCDKKRIPYKKCGKLIVAVENEEVPRLQSLYDRGRENGVADLRLLDSRQLRDIEPHCTGKVAIHSPSTGIVDWGRVTRTYGEDFKEMGGHIYTNFKVNRFSVNKTSTKGSEHYNVVTAAAGKPVLTSQHVIGCCGLYSDRVAVLSGCSPEPRIVPFRGEYLLLRPEKRHLVRGNIYPVPDPQFPFLGVHFTPRMDGEVWLGPNAVLALAREGYSATDFNWEDFKEILRFRGLRKLVMRYWRLGTQEALRSLLLAAQVRQLRRFIPELQSSDVTRGPTGVRAQAMDTDGRLIEDFVFALGEGEMGRRILHVRNAPSPAATSSLAIAEMVADKARDTFGWTT